MKIERLKRFMIFLNVGLSFDVFWINIVKGIGWEQERSAIYSEIWKNSRSTSEKSIEFHNNKIAQLFHCFLPSRALCFRGGFGKLAVVVKVTHEKSKIICKANDDWQCKTLADNLVCCGEAEKFLRLKLEAKTWNINLISSWKYYPV